VEALQQCALEQPEIALIVEETSASALDFSSGDLTLWFGEPSQGFLGYAATLGQDEIVIIAGNDVALRNLTREKLTELYSQPSPMYQVWTYGEDNELRSMFDSIVLVKPTTSGYLQLAPDPAAMLEAVTTDPMAIGYIPRAWLGTGEVQLVTIEPELQRDFQQPILALASTEPEGNLKSYLVCLQQGGIP